MTARFRLEGTTNTVVLTPETDEDRLLLAAFARHEESQFHVIIDRHDDGRLEEVTLRRA